MLLQLIFSCRCRLLITSVNKVTHPVAKYKLPGCCDFLTHLLILYNHSEGVFGSS